MPWVWSLGSISAVSTHMGTHPFSFFKNYLDAAPRGQLGRQRGSWGGGDGDGGSAGSLGRRPFPNGMIMSWLGGRRRRRRRQMATSTGTTRPPLSPESQPTKTGVFTSRENECATELPCLGPVNTPTQTRLKTPKDSTPKRQARGRSPSASASQKYKTAHPASSGPYVFIWGRISSSSSSKATTRRKMTPGVA